MRSRRPATASVELRGHRSNSQVSEDNEISCTKLSAFPKFLFLDKTSSWAWRWQIGGLQARAGHSSVPSNEKGLLSGVLCVCHEGIQAKIARIWRHAYILRIEHMVDCSQGGLLIFQRLVVARMIEGPGAFAQLCMLFQTSWAVFPEACPRVCGGLGA